MYKDKFRNLIKILDKQISAYDKLVELFEEKREALKKSNSDELGTIDNKILALNNSIVKLNDMRKNASNELLGKDACMSEYIEFSKANQPEFEEPLMLRKVKICNNIDRLVLLNSQNVELINHGIIMSNKMLEVVIDAFAPQGSNYNGAGKTDTHDIDMWTINEEI